MCRPRDFLCLEILGNRNSVYSDPSYRSQGRKRVLDEVGEVGRL